MNLRMMGLAAATLALAACTDTTGLPSNSAVPAQNAVVAAAPTPQLARVVTPIKSFRCDQNYASRWYAMFSATGEFDAAGRPINVKVFRTGAPTAILSSIAAGGGVGMSMAVAGLRAWNVTGGAQAKLDRNFYYLLLPRKIYGPGTYQGEIQVFYNRGNDGWIESLQTCVVS